MAAREGQTDIAKELIKNGATFQEALISPNIPQGTQTTQHIAQGAQTPCHVAAEHGHADTLRYLAQLPHASALTQRASDGMTPLHLACNAAHADVVRVLVNELGADANAVDQKGHSALYYAVRSHCASCVRELLASGARVDSHTFNLARDQGNKIIIGLVQQQL